MLRSRSRSGILAQIPSAPSGNLTTADNHASVSSGFVLPPCWLSFCSCSPSNHALAFFHRSLVAKASDSEDLKPMNLLLTKTLDVKVSDFGTGILESAARDFVVLAYHVVLALKRQSEM